MTELIKVNYENDRPTVLGRDLHRALEIKTEYKKWFERMTEYGFEDERDYVKVTQKSLTSSTGQNMTNHQLTIEMAKEICMIQRSEIGKQYRQYFLDLEKSWNTPEAVMARALQYANNQLAAITHQNQTLALENAQQKQIIGELKPKADYTDIILNNKELVTISQIAKDYGMSGRAMNAKLHDLGVQYKRSGQWLLYSKYHGMGYTHSKTINITRSDGSPDVTMETKWTQKGRLFIYKLLKENGILPVIEQTEDKSA